jgi:hypothetical protein
VGTESAAIFIRLSDIVGANRDKPAIGNLELTMELNKSFSLPAVLGAETSATEDENHGMLSLQFGELRPFRGMVGKLIVREDSPWNNVRPHIESQQLDARRRVTSPLVCSRRSDRSLSQPAAPRTLHVKTRQSLGPIWRSCLEPAECENDWCRKRRLERAVPSE